VRGLTLYFAIFIAGRGVMALVEGQGAGKALSDALGLVPLAAACVGLLIGLAWLNARATIYTITTRRVVLRFGVALPISINLPFKQLAAADLVARPEGDGDIALRLTGPGRLAYLPLWPYVRPWRVAPAQPMLRAVPKVTEVSALLAQAVKDFAQAEAASPQPASQLGVVRPNQPPTVTRTFAGA
jgi:hypothetical protein